MEKLIAIFIIFVAFIVMAFVLSCVLAVPTMLLVNYVFSEAALMAVFGGAIGFWKAFWLNFLCGILFKSSISSATKRD